MREDFFEAQDPAEKINYRATFKLLIGLIKPHKAAFGVAFAWLAASTIVSLANPIVAKYIIDTALPAKNSRQLAWAIAVYFANSLLFLAFNYLMSMRLIRNGQNIIVTLKERMFSHLLSLDLNFYSAHPVGRLTTRVQSDTGALYELFTETAVTIFKDIFMFLAVFCIMAFYNLKLTLILLPVFPFIALFIWLFVTKTSAMFVTVRKLTAELSGFLTEHINAAAVVQAFAQESRVSGELNALNRKKFQTELKAETLVVFFFLTILFLHPAATAAIFGAGAGRVARGELSVGVLVMFILYLGQLFEPIFRFSEHVGIIQRSAAAGHRIFKILEERPAIKEAPSPHFAGAMRERLEFRNVSMRYGPEGECVLNNVSFKLEKGSSLAIVGETGGGKTTIANLLFRFYPIEKGKILIDGVDINSLSLRSLRSAIGLVQQDIYLFPGTIMDNLKLMDASVPDAKVHEAVRLTGLEAFFRKHPFTKTVVEKGANLSIGEKQVIALARALVLDQEVLVLDEATSHMDPYTERLVTGAIQNILKRRTLIIIAHRLSTIKNVDRILLLSKGEIQEEGAHSELMAAGGMYSRLYKLQLGDD